MYTKKQLQTQLDLLRRNPKSHVVGTEEFTRRMKLEQRLDNHLYAKEK